MLDFRSPIPLYSQLAEVLTRRIAAGDYQAGARIPSEPELAHEFSVGRPTVRQAIEVLVRRGALNRRRGAGTFVRDHQHQVDLFSLGGTVAAFESQGIRIASNWVDRPSRVVVAPSGRSPLAGCEAYLVRRLSSLEECPVLLEEIYLRADAFPNFDRIQGDTRSISELVRDEYRMQPTRGHQLFRVVELDIERAALLRATRGRPALLVERTLDFPGADAAVYAELYCLTDQVVLSQTLGGETR